MMHYRLLRAKARTQTTQIMRKYRARCWWSDDLSLWTESEKRLAWGDR